MIYLEAVEVIRLQEQVIAASGGGVGLLDFGKLESAIAQPRMTFAGEELYPTLAEKAAALGFSLTCNHAFVDGNKRIGHAAMELMLLLNGHEIQCSVDEQEQVFLRLAAGTLTRDEFTAWVAAHCHSLPSIP